MKSKILLLIFTLSTAVAVGYLLVPDRPTTPPSPATVTDDRIAPDPEHFAVKPTVAATSPEPDSPFEIVHGLRVRKNRNCTVEIQYLDAGNGTVIEAYSCTPNQPSAPGALDHYDDEALAAMSYSDALAAEVLGKRLAEADPERARALLLRSVALKPQNTSPLLWLASENYSLVATNGEPAILEMTQKYLLSRVAEELGTPGAAASIRNNLTSIGFEETDFLALEKDVVADLAMIRSIQIEVTGHSDLPEVAL